MSNAKQNDEEQNAVVSHDLTIGGVKVRFPCKPYPAQTVLMSKIIAGIKNSQNCLLESPTGSGKTLALLCAALAWQNDEYAKKRKYDLENINYMMEAVNDGTKACDSCDCAMKTCDCSDVKAEVLSDDDDVVLVEDDPDFKPQQPKRKPIKKEENDMFECECGCHHPVPKMALNHEEYHVPRIYYGTRTHKQIAQLTSELARTAYRNVKMDILASREHTCINETVARGGNKNEECKKLLDQPGGYACPFKAKVPKVDDYDKLYEAGITQAWDLETFVDVCRTKGACPYFATRELFSKADIVFCPYSYLIDPFIRNTMNIALKRDIVIFDEAHNIEDACREAASIQITSQDMDEIERSLLGWETPLMLATLERLKNYIHEEGAKITDTEVGGQMVTSPILGGATMVAHLENRLGLDHATCVQLNSDLSTLIKAKQSDEVIDKTQRGGKSTKTDPAISVKLETVLEHLLGICDFIQQGGNKHAEDFRMLVSKQQVTVEDHGTPRPGPWRGRGRGGGGGGYRHEINYALHFWCLNPAVVFQSIVENARCIVLASGTLSPMNTFQSELGTTFPIQFEAGHVIGKGQAFAACVGVSPRDRTLQAVYKNTETLEFQDGIGELVEEVCSVTPGGVLLFLTSYRLIDKMVDRWRSTGLYSRLQNLKQIFIETSGATSRFEETLAEFYASCGKPMTEETSNADDVISDDEDAEDEYDNSTQARRFFGNRLIQTAKKRKLDETGTSKRKAGVTPMSQRGKTVVAKPRGSSGSGNGALFLAVYRGKVSEGLNFADDYCRSVIAVGIPYPAFMDPQVKEKRNYNEMHCKQRQILSGAEWYECQAFRALNQALGRCIRHRRDWGAIVLVDERFTIPKLRCNDKISKWVRERRTIFSNFPQFRRCLVDFIESEKLEGENSSGGPKSVAPMLPKIAPPPPKLQPVTQQSSQLTYTPLNAFVRLPNPRPIVVPTSKMTTNVQSPSIFQQQPQRPSTVSPPFPPQTNSFLPAVVDDLNDEQMTEDSISPDVFDSAFSERSASASTVNFSPVPTAASKATTDIPEMQQAPVQKPMSTHLARCSRCREDIFSGNCFLLSTSNPSSTPVFISNYYHGRHIPPTLHIADVGKFGVRGHDQLVSTLVRVESKIGFSVVGICAPLNSNFEPDDMITYDCYICKCQNNIRVSDPTEIFCWSIVGIQPGNTAISIAGLLNKVIFNPYAALLSPILP